jgi:hypothetical protein
MFSILALCSFSLLFPGSFLARPAGTSHLLLVLRATRQSILFTRTHDSQPRSGLPVFASRKGVRNNKKIQSRQVNTKGMSSAFISIIPSYAISFRCPNIPALERLIGNGNSKEFATSVECAYDWLLQKAGFNV